MKEEVLSAVEQAVDMTILKTVVKYAQTFRALADDADLASLKIIDTEDRAFAEGFAEGIALCAISLEAAAKELDPKVAA